VNIGEMADRMQSVRELWIDELRNEVEQWELEEASCSTEQSDAFVGDLRFGTGGIRCLMGIGPNRMNRLTIGKATQGLAMWLLETRMRKPRVVIGYDTRLHSRDFAEVTASVLAANGIHVYLFREFEPTPVVDFAIGNLGCTAGVCITASHNPREYNGYKVYGRDGVQATDVMARAIQAKIERVNVFDDVVRMPLEDAESAGLLTYVGENVLDDYISAVLSERFCVKCSELKVVYSPLCGTGRKLAERVLSDMGVEYSLVNEQSIPDGLFASCPKPNPENVDAMNAGMAQMVIEGADLFLATDPDADRVGVACMDHGRPKLLAGNDIALLLFDYACNMSVREHGTSVAVTTIVTAPLADAIATVNGIELRRTLTGFKYVGEQIGLIEAKSREFLLGFEESDGYLKGSYVRDKDGICALMLVCEVAAYYKSLGITLADALDKLYARYGYMLGKQLSFELAGVEGAATISRTMTELRKRGPISIAEIKITEKIDYLPGAPMPVVGGPSTQVLPPSDVLEWRLEGGSRVLLRPSGTEPKLKAYVFAQGTTHDEAATLLSTLCAGVTAVIDSAMNRKRRELPLIHVVLLSGGSGSRLWPLSNSTRSKQFLKVLRDENGRHVSMVQRVFDQIASVDADLDITIATSASQSEALSMQVGGKFELAVEPERRDTAPAIMLSCAHLGLVQGAQDDDPVIVMPIDTFADQAFYNCISTIAQAVSSDVADLVLLGAKPTYPSEKYGYILPSSAMGSALPVEEFREKPSLAMAESYIARGGLWNCGVFGFKLGLLQRITREYVDVSTYDEMLDRYRELPKNSFDYEVVENADSISVVPYSGMWKDLGTWNTLAETMAEEISGPVWVDKDTVSNVHIINETGLPLVVAGLANSVVVATPDGVLVTGKEESAHIKSLIEEASSKRPMYEKRQWGEYRILDEGLGSDTSHAITKELVILSGHQISYKRHQKRLKTWVVTKGSGEVVIDGEIRPLKVGDTIRIAPMKLHGCRAIHELHIVEVQVGWPLVEDDVERFGCYWHD